ncbi:MAG: TatD family hydrolase [Candidatus Endonucleobacter bathymodioli]|uniref:TatD family hydrolase n=1 Tax=Candidatus Endonucleibacter bathymodioli TaxID=539814 RepID=A0AA90NSQ6_9GAMM|nr:TatD family hydrolase [Candidatus Endonucleobacter bathymodioli]
MNDYLVDIGVNITHTSFDLDRDIVIKRAQNLDVALLIFTGTSVLGSRQALELATQYNNCYSTAGVHPHDAKNFGVKSYDELKSIITSSKVVAVGETGLDFNRDYSPRNIQEKVFIQQIELAIELGKPLFCHVRDASQRFLEIINTYRGSIGRLVVHCFTEDKETLFKYLDLDLHIGITGWICDERRGTHLHPLVKSIPPNRLMIETDAPYLLPRTLSSKPKNRRNEPAFLSEVVKTLAKVTKKDCGQIISETTATAKKFFNLDRGE